MFPFSSQASTRWRWDPDVHAHVHTQSLDYKAFVFNFWNQQMG